MRWVRRGLGRRRARAWEPNDETIVYKNGLQKTYLQTNQDSSASCGTLLLRAVPTRNTSQRGRVGRSGPRAFLSVRGSRLRVAGSGQQGVSHGVEDEECQRAQSRGGTGASSVSRWALEPAGRSDPDGCVLSHAGQPYADPHARVRRQVVGRAVPGARVARHERVRRRKWVHVHVTTSTASFRTTPKLHAASAPFTLFVPSTPHECFIPHAPDASSPARLSCRAVSSLCSSTQVHRSRLGPRVSSSASPHARSLPPSSHSLLSLPPLTRSAPSLFSLAPLTPSSHSLLSLAPLLRSSHPPRSLAPLPPLTPHRSTHSSG